MLSTQVDYWKLIESGRHNKEQERLDKLAHEENVRHNESQEFLTQIQLEENKRHNIESERLNQANIIESQRHNVQSEQVGWYSAQSGQIKDQVAREQAQASTNQANAAISNAHVNVGKLENERKNTFGNLLGSVSNVVMTGVKVASLLF